MEAPDFEARLKIVGDRSDEIAEDCRDALKEPVHELIEDRAILVRQAVNAFIDGHHEAAQALAVVVCDSYLKTHFDGLGYTKMREKLTLDQSDDAALWTVFRYDMPMATAVRFLVDWKSHKHPVPSNFSRHVTIHGASTAQLNSLHATLAIMLAATMTRALDAILEPGGNAPETVASGGK
ncbi:hypothetical protein AZG88_34830 [Rhodococcus sp. LB1]|nr:hypothetical protein AZG88_34830 [Rhodococcus sp. LB1]